MTYEAELQFLKKVLAKYHLQILDLAAEQIRTQTLDLGLRRMLGKNSDGPQVPEKMVHSIKHNTIYRVTDVYMCTYHFLLLPRTRAQRFLIIGPLLTVDPTSAQMMEWAEQSGIHPTLYKTLEQYYAQLPVIVDLNSFNVLLHTFGETIWGSSEDFNMEDINDFFADDMKWQQMSVESRQAENTLQHMQLIEDRYKAEKELLKAVSQGLTHKVETMLSSLPGVAFEQRVADPIRNIKNYGITCNTLLRRAAEEGAVHPVYLDQISDGYARRIERITSIKEGQRLILEMFRAYCRLVNKHSMKPYSPPVQRAIIYIDSNLSEELSVKKLAQVQNMNASYLSTLFKKEVGQTITEYISQSRIKTAIQLLTTTKLQIQAIAQHCGITDVNYFSKVFKKYTTKTPKEYRKSIQA